MADPFGDWLHRQRCTETECDRQATHSTPNGNKCNTHTPRDRPAFALND